MNWELRVDKAVGKYLKRVPKREAERIFAVIQDLPENPYVGDIEKMESEENAWRRRIGNYRIFYEIITKRKLIHVTDVRRRTSSTY